MNCPRCGDRISIPRFDGRCSACAFEYRQPFAIRCLKRWTWTTWPDRSAAVPQHGPTEGLATHDADDPDRGPYLFACKSKLHEGVYASFSATLLGAARPSADDWRVCVLFVGPGPYGIEDALAFDPRRFLNQATDRERNRVDSKRERDVPIFDARADEHGIPLGDYLSGARRLPGPEPSDGTYEATLRQFGVEREGVSSA